MKRFLFVVAILFGLIQTACATTYYISPTGSDSNNGLSTGAPWLTPDHAVNCGDVIQAAAGTYSIYSFGGGVQWGTVTCAAGNNVAWVQCVTFAACLINSTSGDEVFEVNASYWGVEGWVVSATGTYGGCFIAQPTSTAAIHHIIFADDIANGCTNAGFAAFGNGGVAGVDYIAFIGDIAYNTGGGNSGECDSAFSIGDGIAYDTQPGTHMYMAGNFAWHNSNVNPCNGGTPTDGEGFVFDYLGYLGSYNQQAAAENNLSFMNGGRGIQADLGNNPTFFVNNTSYGNNTDTSQTSYCGESVVINALSVVTYGNLLITAGATACNSITVWGYQLQAGGAGDTLYNNLIYSAAGNNIDPLSSPGFVAGSNLTGSSPVLANPVNPGAPSCGGFASTTACMATVISDYTPTNSAATKYGYHTPSSTPAYDPLYPQWLCNVTLPAGLVTPGCLTSSPGLSCSSGTYATTGVEIQ